MADYNFNDKEVDDIVASYTAYKGKFTTASRKLELLVDLQSKKYSAVTATNINDQSTKAVIDILESWFNVLGWPSSIRSDGGPQFCGPFCDWCQTNNIKHELSAPYNPKSNGLAESAVKM